MTASYEPTRGNPLTLARRTRSSSRWSSLCGAQQRGSLGAVSSVSNPLRTGPMPRDFLYTETAQLTQEGWEQILVQPCPKCGTPTSGRRDGQPECIKCFSEWLAAETDFSAGRGKR